MPCLFPMLFISNDPLRCGSEGNRLYIVPLSGPFYTVGVRGGNTKSTMSQLGQVRQVGGFRVEICDSEMSDRIVQDEVKPWLHYPTQLDCLSSPPPSRPEDPVVHLEHLGPDRSVLKKGYDSSLKDRVGWSA